ncbi:amino acid ABC transporter permease [Acinetobacter rathckeae]|uniref:amino acid ABC transporter permease n=1 Tax=Acinetobacter rathckeae TaxID=2605272 RepID=UPI0018A2519F|nr:amino acid ABC transporter permease [Acinetobacter rathckeae]MBF7688574.1 amino acid ABC transporter permease [Acinetobacter rathckeae]MBF7695821.1 amino acid ABC transporter permease [Acinetobacter rathckeae]
MSIDLMWQYFLSPEFLQGAWMTLLITLCSLLCGVVLGLLLALLQEAPSKAGKTLAFFYVWLFRGTPVLFQIIFIYNVLPSFGLSFSAFTCAVLALSLNEGAYMAEILRSGLQAVKSGQRTAGMALGMTNMQIMRKVVLPQAARIVLPPMGNQMISMLKSSALVSVIAVQELLLVANQTASASFRYFEALCAAGVYYLLLTSLFMAFQSWLERVLDPKQRRLKQQKAQARDIHTAETSKTM